VSVVTDGARRWQAGLAAYASQFQIPEDEVHEYLRSRMGERLATEAILASGAAWTDDCLSHRDRSLVVLAALTVQGGVEPRLRTHARWALDHGATAEELEALAALLAVYTCYPKASVAMEVFRDVIAEYDDAGH
jgi:alkylhydroperoxidase/carboxymuconolactone decarboxylase family protein YurZ